MSVFTPLLSLLYSLVRFSPTRLLSCQGSVVSNPYWGLVTLLRVHFKPLGYPFEWKRIAVNTFCPGQFRQQSAEYCVPMALR
ncbi:hypothetical protein MiSe_12290 [Microseira wollei NIES-4236]|uniref:Secreted protein n=1 Tax=Microseira wollei NIES-4236 TaxID=2530354 RepID=A0AAV3X580_9CYAN|nr:hypothetical protein MiSe_12290 [Microseira wollei NIES-4236]